MGPLVRCGDCEDRRPMTAQPPIRRNVELKGRDPDPARSLATCLEIGAEDHGIRHQVDTYFATQHGRLKLREENGEAWLIPYVRGDAASARESRYRLVEAPEPAALKAALTETLGVRAVVVKDRRLFLWNDVRIHLDCVRGLGDFLELEAVASPGSDLVVEHDRVRTLREALGLGDDRLVSWGYADALLGTQNSPS